MNHISSIPVCDLANVFDLPDARAHRNAHRFLKMIKTLSVSDRRVLEIGAGDGFLSCMLKYLGARSVTALEPESSGSSESVVDRFTRSINALELEDVAVLPLTFQDFSAPPDSYDLIVSIASVNHLNEGACEVLCESDDAKQTYLGLFQKMHRMLDTNGVLLLADCGRNNLLGCLPSKLRMKHPFAPSIEWKKHQQPNTWATLLGQAGFHNVVWEWVLPIKLKYSIDTFFDNAPMAYLTSSFFILKAIKR